jgi:anti-sigma regulatory factor (Ser/Thr protein kinase)
MTVTDASQVGEARRGAATLGAEAGLAETERGTLAVVVTELATNLARYAREGVLALRTIGVPGRCGVEVLALDRGPGILDLNKAMTDGYSSGGTAGKGLGAVRRMASEFEVMSSPTGTAIMARMWSAAGARARAAEPRTDGVVCTAIQGERACGDGWFVTHGESRTLAVIVDGLGHGIDAAKAADEALRIVRDHIDATPGMIIQAAHGALRATRGAAMAVADIRPALGEVRFAGVGNIAGNIVSPSGTKSMASHNGTVGHTMPRTQEFTYDCPADACVIMHSDGIMTRWRIEAYPGLGLRHPALIAGVLYRDFLRGRDDATVLAVRTRAVQSPA